MARIVLAEQPTFKVLIVMINDWPHLWCGNPTYVELAPVTGVVVSEGIIEHDLYFWGGYKRWGEEKPSLVSLDEVEDWFRQGKDKVWIQEHPDE